jgi:hypothetical protein
MVLFKAHEILLPYHGPPFFFEASVLGGLILIPSPTFNELCGENLQILLER